MPSVLDIASTYICRMLCISVCVYKWNFPVFSSLFLLYSCVPLFFPIIFSLMGCWSCARSISTASSGCVGVNLLNKQQTLHLFSHPHLHPFIFLHGKFRCNNSDQIFYHFGSTDVLAELSFVSKTIYIRRTISVIHFRRISDENIIWAFPNPKNET